MKSLYKTILMVDDDRDDQQLFIEMLQEVDPTVAWALADGGQQALDVLMKMNPEKPDLIFLDINMPRMDGLQFLQVIKQKIAYREIPIIIFSTGRDIPREECHKLGAALCIQKPYVIAEYRYMMQQVLTTDIKKEYTALRVQFDKRRKAV